MNEQNIERVSVGGRLTGSNAPKYERLMLNGVDIQVNSLMEPRTAYVSPDVMNMLLKGLENMGSEIQTVSE